MNYIFRRMTMRFHIRKKYLLQSIQTVSNAISSRTVIPALTGMKIEVTPSAIILTGSNSDITIQSHIPKVKKIATDQNEVMEEEIITNIELGSIVLPVPHFPDIIKKLPEEIVEISVEENYKTIISSGKAVFTLHGQSVEEYPHVDIHAYDENIAFDAKNLKTLIRQTVFAVSAMETRPILTGVHVSIKENNVVFTATDSHRLSLRSSKTPTEGIGENQIVIPGKSLTELNKIIDDHDGSIKMAILQNQVLFFTDDFYFLSRLLSGNYPDTSRLIPKESETTIHVYTKELVQTIERAALLSNRDQNNVIRLDTLSDHQLEITSNAPEIGNVQEQLSAISIQGEALKISFSSKYLLDTLRTIDSEKVQINFTGAMRPFIIKTPEDDHILQLILPVRTY